jgi:O-antigen/teichoic acid export membrane protein
VSLAQRALRGALWSSLESVGSQATSFLLFLAFARLISPASIGVVQIAVTLLGFLTIFVEHGFTTRIVRAPSSTPEMLNTAFYLSVGGAVSIASTLTIASDRIASLYDTPEVAPVLRMLAWTILLTTLCCVQTALLYRDLAFKTQALRRLAAVLGGGVVGLAMAFNGYGIWSLVARFAVESLLDCVIAWVFTPWRPGLAVSRAEAKEYFGFGSRIVGSYSINYLSKRGDELLIGFVLGSAPLGYYAVAVRAITLVTEVALRAARNTAVPVFSRLQDEPERLREAYVAAVRFATAVACPIFFGMSAVARELCIALYGSRWEPVIPAMQVLGFAGTAICLGIYTPALFVAIGRPDWLMRFSILETVVNLATALLVVRFGILWVAIGYVARAYLMVPVLIVLTNRILKTTWMQMLQTLAAPTAASLAMFGVVFLVRRELPLPPVLTLIVLVSTGALVYLAAMFLLGRSTLRSMLAIAQTLRRSA